MPEVLEAEHQTQSRALQLVCLSKDREGGNEGSGVCWEVFLLNDTQRVLTKQQCLLCMCFRPEF